MQPNENLPGRDIRGPRNSLVLPLKCVKNYSVDLCGEEGKVALSCLLMNLCPACRLDNQSSPTSRAKCSLSCFLVRSILSRSKRVDQKETLYAASCCFVRETLYNLLGCLLLLSLSLSFSLKTLLGLNVESSIEVLVSICDQLACTTTDPLDHPSCDPLSWLS